MFDFFVFLPLSTRAYFKDRAYIKIILKNHARFILRVGLIIGKHGNYNQFRETTSLII